MDNIIRKLSSRKFLAMVSSIVVALLVYVEADEAVVEQVGALIGMFGSILTYIITEGAIDAKNLESTRELDKLKQEVVK